MSLYHFVSFQCRAKCLLVITDGVYLDAPSVQLAFPRHDFSRLCLVYSLVVTLPFPHFLGTASLTRGHGQAAHGRCFDLVLHGWFSFFELRFKN